MSLVLELKFKCRIKINSTQYIKTFLSNYPVQFSGLDPAVSPSRPGFDPPCTKTYLFLFALTDKPNQVQFYSFCASTVGKVF